MSIIESAEKFVTKAKRPFILTLGGAVALAQVACIPAEVASQAPKQSEPAPRPLVVRPELAPVTSIGLPYGIEAMLLEPGFEEFRLRMGGDVLIEDWGQNGPLYWSLPDESPLRARIVPDLGNNSNILSQIATSTFKSFQTLFGGIGETWNRTSLDEIVISYVPYKVSGKKYTTTVQRATGEPTYYEAVGKGRVERIQINRPNINTNRKTPAQAV